jgi:DNA repair exonuclease SbcCD ATPase subunit
MVEKFMSYLKETFDYEGCGLTLVDGENLDDGGSNGAGKTVVVGGDAISWCIFGQTIRGMKHDEVVNRYSDTPHENCHVNTKLDRGSDEFSVHRYRKHHKHNNAFFYFLNGERVEESDVKDTQRRLLDDLGIDFELFKCSVIFGQEDTFNFVNETDKKQKEILSKVRRVDMTPNLKSARTNLKELEDDKDELQRKIDILESHLEDDPGSGLKDEESEWSAGKTERVDSHQGKIAGVESELDSAKKSTGDLKNLKIKHEEITKKFDRLNEIRCEMHNKRTEATIEIRGIERKNKERTEVGEADECPYCEQSIDGDHLERRKKGDEKKLRIFKGVVDQATAKIEKIDETRVIIKDELEATNKSLADIEYKKLEVSRLEDQLTELKDELKEIKSEKNPFTAKIKEAIEKQKKIKLKLKELNAESKELDEYLPYFRFWEKAYSDSGIKSFLFDTMCSALTNKANKFVNILTGGNVTISFDTQTLLKSGAVREKFECVVCTEGEKVLYRTYSGGEKTRISLAVDMSLSCLMADYYGSTFNFVVFDEQDLYLDDQGRDYYLELLKELARDRRVFVVSHDSELKAKFDDVITIQKKDRISRIAA